jgi:hypothetical protein
LTDGSPLSLLLELGLEQVCALFDDKGVSLLYVLVEVGLAFYEGVEFSFEDHPCDDLIGCRNLWVYNCRVCWDWYLYPGFMNDARSDVPSFLVFSTNVVGDALVSVDGGVCLTIVAAVEDVSASFSSLPLNFSEGVLVELLVGERRPCPPRPRPCCC